jgi:hypothetical protein
MNQILKNSDSLFHYVFSIFSTDFRPFLRFNDRGVLSLRAADSGEIAFSWIAIDKPNPKGI